MAKADHIRGPTKAKVVIFVHTINKKGRQETKNRPNQPPAKKTKTPVRKEKKNLGINSGAKLIETAYDGHCTAERGGSGPVARRCAANSNRRIGDHAETTRRRTGRACAVKPWAMGDWGDVEPRGNSRLLVALTVQESCVGPARRS